MSMNPDIKAEWVAALRDPETKQTKGTLNRVAPDPERPDYLPGAPVGNCCLGVLCEIAVKHGVTERDESDAESRGVVGYVDTIPEWDGTTSTFTETGVLPTIVRDWAGLPDYNPDVVTEDGHKHSLAILNDRGTSFADLADLIDAQL